MLAASAQGRHGDQVRYFKQSATVDGPALALMRQQDWQSVGDVWLPAEDAWEPHPSLTVSMETNNDWDEISVDQVPAAKNEVRARYESVLAEAAEQDSIPSDVH